MSRLPSRTCLASSFAMLVAAVWFPCVACGQTHAHDAPAKKPPAAAAPDDHMMGMADHAMSDMGKDSIMSLHMQMTPMRTATHDDSTRALALVGELRRAIAKYKDVSVAERDGFQMFLPNVKNQRVYHFTSSRNAFKEAFRFDPDQPTSLLYKRGANGQMMLIGAMYTMPKRAGLDQLDARVPLGIAQWHKHINWCLPKRGETARWLERQDGRPVFGPESAIATKEGCDAVGGDFHESLFGWMIHANVYAGEDLGKIFGDEHMEHGQ
jgi:hypothetical protein